MKIVESTKHNCANYNTMQFPTSSNSAFWPRMCPVPPTSLRHLISGSISTLFFTIWTHVRHNSPVSYLKGVGSKNQKFSSFLIYNSIWVCANFLCFLNTQGTEKSCWMGSRQEIVAILLGLGRVATFARWKKPYFSKVVSTIDQWSPQWGVMKRAKKKSGMTIWQLGWNIGRKEKKAGKSVRTFLKPKDMAMSKNEMNEYMNGREGDVCSRVKIEEKNW